MKLKSILSCLAVVLMPASATFAATLAQWTFESLTLSAANTNAPPNGWVTNVTAESGSVGGTASGFHNTAAAVYSTPAGNGSSKSLSANNWSANDFYQFAVSTVGDQNVVVSFDQVSSSTGPGRYYLAYSTDGITFTQFGSIYNVTNAPSWSSGSAGSALESFSFDLSSITAINNAPIVYLRLVDANTTSSAGSTTATGGTDRVDNFTVTAASSTPPAISGVSPSSLTLNAGDTAAFTVTLSAGDSPLTYYWYKETPLTTNLISTVTDIAPSNTLTLVNVLLADAANYQVVVSNAIAPAATSAVVSLTVIDPAINVQPVSQTGLLHGMAQFTVSAAGTSVSGLTYQWYFCSDPNNNTQITSPVGGSLPSGSIVSGATSSALTISNLHNSDPTNFVVVVTGTYGSVTSSVASLTVANTGPLAFWNFNIPSPFFNITNPAPYQGIGTASSTNCSPFEQVNQDGNDFATPNFAWGTSNYLATTSNKMAGVQFKTSTVGAKNIMVSYDLRCTTTASKYQRLQYTTNGTDFIDFPANSISTSGNYLPRNFSLVGFPGVANNPNFGIRVVAEFESTALYNNTNDDNYVGVSAAFGSAGTMSYDLVTISADAITNGNAAPTIGTVTNETIGDTIGGTNNFTVSDDADSPGSLSVTAKSLDPSVNLSFNPQNVGGTVHLGISSNLGISTSNNVPVLVTVTDSSGDSTVAWFTLTITPANAPPTLTGLINTNMLTNSTLVIPFTLADDHTPVSDITPTVDAPYNTVVVPNDASHVSLSGSGASRFLTITPAADQEGTVPITVAATDGGGKTTTQTIYVTVCPNTNIVLLDNFSYDNSPGALDLLSGGFWQLHSGIGNQLQVGPGQITVDSVNHTEDVNAPLLGQPYMTNSGAVLYSKMMIQFTTLPDSTGAYFAHFKDNTTFGFLCRIWASSNSPTTYRIGIGNSSGSSSSTAKLAQPLNQNVYYTVVSRLVLSNGVSTVWINPSSESDPSVTAEDSTNSAGIVTNLVNIYAYAFRESNTSGGIVNVSNLVVGTTFNGVLGIAPSLNIQLINNQVVLTWNDGSFGLQSSTNVAGPYTTVVGSNGSPYTNNISGSTLFFRLFHP
jgi:Immunoglobulin domain